MVRPRLTANAARIEKNLGCRSRTQRRATTRGIVEGTLTTQARMRLPATNVNSVVICIRQQSAVGGQWPVASRQWPVVRRQETVVGRRKRAFTVHCSLFIVHCASTASLPALPRTCRGASRCALGRFANRPYILAALQRSLPALRQPACVCGENKLALFCIFFFRRGRRADSGANPCVAVIGGDR